MSYYYNYYLGYKKDGKIYPLGPYDVSGTLHNVISRSRSFASNLHEDFFLVKEDEVSDKLRDAFQYTNFNNEKQMRQLKVLPLSMLPNDNYIRSGYFLIEDIKNYLENGYDAEGLFYERIEPTVYAMMLKNELAIGKMPERFDDEGNAFENHSTAEYSFFSYPDYYSKEYEAFLINQTAKMFEYSDILKDAKIVVLETEG